MKLKRALVFVGRKLPDTLSGAIIGVGAGGLPWAIVDAVSVSGGGVSFVRAMLATGRAAAIAGLAILVAVVLAVIAYRFVEGCFGVGRFCGAQIVATTLSFLALGYVVYGANAASQIVFSGPGVKAVAISTVALFGVAGLAWLSRVLTGRLISLFGDGPGPLRSFGRVAIWAVAVFLIWLGSLALLEREVFQALAPWKYWPFALTFFGGLAGGLLFRFSRWVLVLSFMSVALFSGLFLGDFTSQYPPALRPRLAQKSAGAGLVFEYFDPLAKRRSPVKTDGKAPTCYPGEAMPVLPTGGMARKGAPDIILVTVDAMRFDHTSLGGYERDTTPNIKRWSASGTVFTGAITPSASTRQTFGALFTGLHPLLADFPTASNKGWTVSLRGDQPKMAQFLEAAGYETVAVMVTPWAFMEKDHALDGFKVRDTTPARTFKKRKYGAPLQVDRIISHLSLRDSGRPRFIWAHLMETHQPYQVGPHPKRFGNKPQDRYDAALYFVDGELDRLISFVMGPTRRDNTFLIVAADHGQAFHEHGNNLHGHTVYEEEVHVPLVIWGPRIKGRSIDAPVSLLDIPPTLLDMAGAPPVGALCGSSLLPAARGGKDPVSPEVYTEVIPDAKMNSFMAGYYRDDHKLIVSPKLMKKELYHLGKDPQEKNDLAAKNPDMLREMTEALRAYYLKRGMDPSYYGL